MKTAWQVSALSDPFLSEEPRELAAGLRLRESAVSVSARDASTSGTGTLITVIGSADGAELARCLVAEGEVVQRAFALSADVARTHAALLEFEAADDPQVLAALSYAAARRARVMDRVSLLVSRVDAGARALELFRARPIVDTELATQRVDIAAHYAAQALKDAGTPVSSYVRAREAEETVKRWLATGNQWGFFKAIRERTLTREQYVYALSNIYQFVRQTTRLCARAIAYSADTELRTHFIHHMNGEINHELIIEKDLTHLGEDVAYVRDFMAPNGPTQEFMSIQESLIGYYQDPVLLMASPLAAEGVSAHLDQAFEVALKECIASWGVEKPERAAKFFVSHIHTDGGDDGHWGMTVEFLSKCLLEEPKHQFFIRSMKSAMRGTRRLYDSFVADLPSHTLSPARRTSGREALEAQA